MKTASVILFSLWLGLAAGVGLTESDELTDKVCQICGEPIVQGQYVTLGNEIYHRRCFESKPKCLICGYPILNTVIQNQQGQCFHEDCYNKTPRCMMCRQPIISGKYIELEDGSRYHKNCYDQAPKCSLCEKPLTDDMITMKGQRYHRSCYEEALKCDVCNYRSWGNIISTAIAGSSARLMIRKSPVLFVIIQSGSTPE